MSRRIYIPTYIICTRYLNKKIDVREIKMADALKNVYLLWRHDLQLLLATNTPCAKRIIKKCKQVY